MRHPTKTRRRNILRRMKREQYNELSCLTPSEARRGGRDRWRWFHFHRHQNKFNRALELVYDYQSMTLAELNATFGTNFK